MKKRAAFYLRVSTGSQTLENQRRELKAAARRHGWHVVNVFQDKASGSTRDRRPGFLELEKAISRRTIDLVAAWSVDRLGRSLTDLVAFLGELKSKGVDLYLHRQGLDTSTPAGKALFQMLGVFSEFERELIQERVRAGLARARAQGKVLGRPKISPALEALIRHDLKERESIGSICRKHRVGSSTVQRVIKESAQKADLFLSRSP